MNEEEWLAKKFEENRGHLRAVAYRMLGSATEADDAVQEAWLRLSRSDAKAIENLGGWLTTVVARVCLDILRSRDSRREQALDEQALEEQALEEQTSEPIATTRVGTDPEQELLLADSVGLALLVVLDRLSPPERIAFVLHDMFGMAFDEIAGILGRSPTAARQLASRARRRVQGVDQVPGSNLSEQREAVGAFLNALRAGDFDGLLAILDPDVVVRLDSAAGGPGAPTEIRGAKTWAKGALAFSHLARSVQPMLVDGAVGLVWAPRGRALRVLRFTVADGKIVQVELIANPARLPNLELALLQ